MKKSISANPMISPKMEARGGLGLQDDKLFQREIMEILDFVGLLYQP